MHHDGHVIWLEILGAYPTVHLVVAPLLLKYLPDPGETKSYYSAAWHLLEWFAVGNAKPKTPTS